MTPTTPLATPSALAPELRATFNRDLLLPVAGHALAAHAGGARVLGIYGAQGSGKTTLSAALGEWLRLEHGLRVAVLSLDDFYLTRAHRERVAKRMHPLFATRGVPGTHDIPLLLRTLDALLPSEVRAARASGGLPEVSEVRVPVFDKASDDRASEARVLQGPVDVVVLEGWCLGVPPQAPEDLLTPCNALEAQEDPSGRFRRCVNYRLAHDYADLAKRVDWLLALMVESFDVSREQRREQEHALRARTGRGMSDDEVDAFMQRFERVSRWALACMSERADLVVRLDRQHRPREPIPEATRRA